MKNFSNLTVPKDASTTTGAPSISHPLSELDEEKKNCGRSLSDQNQRRTPTNSASLPPLPPSICLSVSETEEGSPARKRWKGMRESQEGVDKCSDEMMQEEEETNIIQESKDSNKAIDLELEDLPGETQSQPFSICVQHRTLNMGEERLQAYRSMDSNLPLDMASMI
ncbi:hypothetical protein HHK36_005602 [Tetracentron sinense]|uniref:Uncharacterized protein n=1 Tax=Tetracentron sinense TaxID=13715 RepID=A0A834ZPS0_TETSI|nr:hypothetical protein HHK36_005602 [Tetracentron sinense]